MPKDDDKTAAAMATALGVKLADDQDDSDNNDQVTDQDDSQDRQDNQDGDKKDQSDSSDDKKDDQGANSDDSDDKSGGDQKDDASGSDQADSKKVAPDSGSSDDGSDQTASFEATLTERSNGRFKSIADIDKALEEAPANAFANEQIAKLNEYVKGGGKLADFVATQTVDYSKLSPLELIRKQRELESTDLTAEEIQLEIEEDFFVAEDASERAKKLAGIRLKREGAEALRKLKEHQEKWAVPVNDKPAFDLQAWEGQLNTAVDAVGEITVPLNNTDNFTFKIEPEAKEKIRNDHKRLDKFFSRYIKPDGTEDTERFVSDMAKLDNFDAIVRSAASASKSQGKKDVIDNIKNPEFKGDNKKSKEQAPLTIAEQAAREFFK